MDTSSLSPRPLLPRAAVEEVAFSVGVWQRPTWQGRFSSANAVTELDDAKRVCAWVLLRRLGKNGEGEGAGVSAAKTAAAEQRGGGEAAKEEKPKPDPDPGGTRGEEEILWGVFTAEHGFRHAPPGSGAVMALPAPKWKKGTEDDE